MIEISNYISPVEFNTEMANLFLSPKYARLVQSSGDAFYYLFSDTYVIPVRVTKKNILRYASFLSEPYKHHAGGSETVKSFLNDVCDYLRTKLKMQWISETPASALFSEAPDGANSIPFGSHIMDLEDDVATLWNKVHGKHRNVIKKAEKEGVVIEKGNNKKILKDYHSIDLETWGRSNVKAGSFEKLKKLTDALADNIIIYMAYKGGEPQAGAIFYYNKAMCFYMHGASRNHSVSGSGNLLQWRAILDMKEAGIKKYSFVGCRINEDKDSKYHGIQRFKERFGGELFVGKRFRIIFNHTMYGLYRVLVSMRLSLEQKHFVFYKDTIDQESYKWEKR